MYFVEMNKKTKIHGMRFYLQSAVEKRWKTLVSIRIEVLNICRM